MGVGWIGVGGDAKEKKREKILCSNQERLIRAAVSHWEFAGLRWYPPSLLVYWNHEFTGK